MQWFDLGTLGGESCQNEWFPASTSAAEIANTGLVVGYTPTITDFSNPIPHAFAWTAKSGMTDLGTLKDLGHDTSVALAVNKLGTLIVGSSGQTGGKSLPVVWTPEVVWGSHGPTRTWKIHALDTTGFEQIPNWYATAVNDLGQIVGTGFCDCGNVAALWSPRANGKGWTIKQLPTLPGYPNASVNDINNRGEVVGTVFPTDESVYLPALWKPVGLNRGTWHLTVLGTLPMPWFGVEMFGINDLGDIVGAAFGTAVIAVRSSTRDPSSVRVIGVPGDWSVAFKVNNLRIAAGGYIAGDGGERAFAVQIR
jgi:probable HAF family extracellular repeat protein